MPVVLPHWVDQSSARPDRMEEACGVFGVLAPGQQVSSLCYFGLYALQHRGQEAAGIAVFDGDRVRLHKDMGLVSQVFDQDVLCLLAPVAVCDTKRHQRGALLACPEVSGVLCSCVREYWQSTKCTA